MQLTIKTLKGETFNVEAQQNQTILDLKNKIKEIKGFQIDMQKIVFKGKATTNENSLEQLGVKEGDFLVIMMLIKKPEPKVQTKQEKKQQTKEQKKQQKKEQKKVTEQKKEKPKQQNSPQFQEKVNGLVSMGFPKDQCQKALRSAFGDSDRAVEYLCNGIPQNPQPQQIPQGEMAQHALSGIVNHPQFAQIRNLIRNDPSAIGPILQQIASASPQLYQLISQNPETFERLIMQDAPQGGQGVQIPQIPRQPPGSIMITQEQQQAINRLRAFGFSKMDAAQAYLACDKNEDLAANYLFTRLQTGDIEMTNDFSGGLTGNQNSSNQGNSGSNNSNKNNTNNTNNNNNNNKNNNNQGGNNQDDDDNLFN